MEIFNSQSTVQWIWKGTVQILVPNQATSQIHGASVAKEYLCFIEKQTQQGVKLVASADYHEIRARNYIPVPNKTYPISGNRLLETQFSICL